MSSQGAALIFTIKTLFGQYPVFAGVPLFLLLIRPCSNAVCGVNALMSILYIILYSFTCMCRMNGQSSPLSSSNIVQMFRVYWEQP